MYALKLASMLLCSDPINCLLQMIRTTQECGEFHLGDLFQYHLKRENMFLFISNIIYNNDHMKQWICFLFMGFIHPYLNMLFYIYPVFICMLLTNLSMILRIPGQKVNHSIMLQKWLIYWRNKYTSLMNYPEGIFLLNHLHSFSFLFLQRYLADSIM